MQTLLLSIALVFITILIWRSHERPDQLTQACLSELMRRIKKNPRVRADALAATLRSYGFDATSATKVTRLVKPRLSNVGIPKSNHMEILHEVGRAKLFLPSNKE